jgi:hypothetical protein
MPEERKRGFHALEERIHELETEHEPRERGASTEREREAPRQGSPPSEQADPQKKK